VRFDDAVKQTPDVADALQAGLQALSRPERRRVEVSDTGSLRGSINLDDALKAVEPNAPRWDYGVGVRGNRNNDRAIWVEFHPASSGHVDEVIRKGEWLRSWLSTRAPDLDRLTPKSGAFKWVATGSTRLRPGSRRRKKVAAVGIAFCGSRLSI